jgi:SAM-dependent methyltransferase
VLVHRLNCTMRCLRVLGLVTLVSVASLVAVEAALCKVPTAPHYTKEGLLGFYCPCSCTVQDELEWHLHGPRKCEDGSLERHRFWCAYWDWFYDRVTEEPKRFLHVAAESPLLSFLKRKFPDAEFVGIWKDADGRYPDLDNLEYANDYFDAVICNHVLERVRNDTAAMAEFFRVLKPGGVGFVSSPFMLSEGIKENPNLQTSEDRQHEYGNKDQFRVYSQDEFEYRLRSVGFQVEDVPVAYWFFQLNSHLLDWFLNYEYSPESPAVAIVATKPTRLRHTSHGMHHS